MVQRLAVAVCGLDECYDDDCETTQEYSQDERDFPAYCKQVQWFETMRKLELKVSTHAAVFQASRLLAAPWLHNMVQLVLQDGTTRRLSHIDIMTPCGHAGTQLRRCRLDTPLLSSTMHRSSR